MNFLHKLTLDHPSQNVSQLKSQILILYCSLMKYLFYELRNELQI